MKKESFKRAVCILSVLLMFITLPGWNLFPKQQTYDFEVNLVSGYKQSLYFQKSAPFKITITGKNSSNFEGYIQMIVPGLSNKNVMYEEELKLGANETKIVEIIAGVPAPAKFVNVRVTDKKHNVVWSELQNINVLSDINTFNIGVLSDDFSALGYLDRKNFLSVPGKSISLIEFDASDFPSDAAALEMIDGMLITDFSTDILTEEQVEALALWVQNGGFLIIGTGSTANKTLSGLKGKITNDTVSSSTLEKSTLGMDFWDYSYVSTLANRFASNANNGSGVNSNTSYQFYNSYREPDSYLTFPFEDYDNDGYNDYYFHLGAHEYNGDLVDPYGVVIAEDKKYLFADDAFEQDPSTQEFHYKYYDERYGKIDPDEYSFLESYFYNYYTEEELLARAYNEYICLYDYDPRGYIYDSFGKPSEADVEKYFDYFYGKDFKEYYDHFLYLYYYWSYYGVDIRPDLSVGNGTSNVEDVYSIDVDCCGIDASDTTAEYIQMESGPFAKITKVGYGYVALCAVDFTKNPLPKTPYAADVIRNMIEMIVGNDFLEKAEEYASNYSPNYFSSKSTTYQEEDLVSAISSAPLPPMIIYAILLGGYFIAILVLYLVMNKKKKTYALWKIYPISAVAVSILVFCLGFSTKVIRLNVSIASIMKPDKGFTKEVDYIGVVVPKAKEYKVDFSNDVNIDRNFDASGGYSSFYQSDVDYDTYAVKYSSGYDTMESIISNKVALEKEGFKTEAAYSTPGGLEINSKTDISVIGITDDNITITNNYSTVIQDVMVEYFDINDGYTYYYFDSIKAGETVLLKTGKKCESKKYYTSYSNELEDRYWDNKSAEIVAGLLLGDLYKPFTDARKRKAILAFIESEYNHSISNDDIIVVGFPKSEIGAKVISDKNCNLKKTEAVYVSKTASEIKKATN
ncbi:MAG: hypothetical protein K5776_01570 [Lachnospiraceae bacterium]|nr:hypothetical protein [Lachnospiraceae bacterium]